MAAESINVVKQIYEGFARGDFGLIGRYFDPDVEVYETELLPWGGHYRGHDGAASFFTKIFTNIDANVEVERFIDAGDCVVGVGRTRGKAKHTGKDFDIAEVHVWELRNEKVVSLRSFVETPAILAALES